MSTFSRLVDFEGFELWGLWSAKISGAESFFGGQFLGDVQFVYWAYSKLHSMAVSPLYKILHALLLVVIMASLPKTLY